MLSEEELGTVDMALHEQIDIAAGHEVIQFLNDPETIWHEHCIRHQKHA